MRLIHLTAVILLSLSACAQKPAIDLPVRYTVDPETPRQSLLDSLVTHRLSDFEERMVTVAPHVKNRFYLLDGKPFSGWSFQELEDYQQIRYYKIDSGFVSWQIGFFENGQVNCDFHSKRGLNHGNQRMWSEDGTPYINTNSINGESHGYQRRWYPNGQLEWEAQYENGKLIWEKNYDGSGSLINVTPNQ